MPENWNATVTTMSCLLGSNKLKFDDVYDLILFEKIRQRESGEASTYYALYLESRGRNFERNSNTSNGRDKMNNQGISRNRISNSINHNNFQSSKNVMCWNCEKIGHYKNQCKSDKGLRGKDKRKCCFLLRK